MSSSSSSIVIRPADVLSGRDKNAYGHDGNNYFRDLVQANREAYQSSPRRALKNAITKKVIGLVQEKKGRFLKLGKDNEWTVMAEDLVYEKVSHALRGAKCPAASAAKRAASNKSKNGQRLLSAAAPAPRRVALSPQLQRRQEEVSAQQRRFFELLVRNDGQLLPNDPHQYYEGANVVSDSSFCDDETSSQAAGEDAMWGDVTVQHYAVDAITSSGDGEYNIPDPDDYQLLSSESLAYDDLPSIGV